VLSNYFKEKETQLQKELGTHEAQRAITEENVNDTVKKIIESEENLITYKSQVFTAFTNLLYLIFKTITYNIW